MVLQAGAAADVRPDHSAGDGDAAVLLLPLHGGRLQVRARPQPCRFQAALVWISLAEMLELLPCCTCNKEMDVWTREACVGFPYICRRCKSAAAVLALHSADITEGCRLPFNTCELPSW